MCHNGNVLTFTADDFDNFISVVSNFESIILSVIGGLMGFVLGYIFAFLISLITPFAPHISWQILGITGAVSLIVGILFGVYPALKAARKDPITSLKFYR